MGRLAQVTGEDGYGMRQVPRSSTKTRQRKSRNWSREKWRFEDRKGSTPNFRRKSGVSASIFVKNEKFDKNFNHFHSLFGFQRGLSSSKGRSPIRASVRTQASEIKRRESRNALNVKMRMIRQQSDGLEQAKREQSGVETQDSTSAPTSERRQTRPRLRGDSRLASPLRQGQKHTRRKRVRRCSRSRKRTVTFAAAGQTFCQKTQADRVKPKDRRCFTQENATTEKFHADVSQNR